MAMLFGGSGVAKLDRPTRAYIGPVNTSVGTSSEAETMI